MYTALTLLAATLLGFIWLLGILRALYLYFRWLRLQQWYCRLLFILFANLGPLLLLFKIDLLDRSLNVPLTILVTLFGLGGVCMFLSISAVGMVHGILICGLGWRRLRRLNRWYQFLLIGFVLELLGSLTHTGVRHLWP